MRPEMKIADFLRQRIYPSAPPALEILARFAGRTIPHTTFDETIQQARQRVEPWMPLYSLPIGEHAGFHIGVHLRPTEVQGSRVAVLRLESAGSIIEVSPSPEHLIYLSLARREGELSQEPDEEFSREVEAVQAVLGADFYKTGSQGQFSDDQAQDVAARVIGPSLEYFYSSALFADDNAQKLELLERGVAKEPGCMALHLLAAQAHVERDEQPQAAVRCAQSLKCYHHTSYEDDLESYYETARSLLEQFPGEFDDDDRRDLDTYGDDKARLLWITELYSAGRVELATKVLCDMCHALQDYESVLHIFRKHFEKLGWSWGLALCEFRQS